MTIDTSSIERTNKELAHMLTVKTLMLFDFDRAEDYFVLNKLLQKYHKIVQEKKLKRMRLNPFAREVDSYKSRSRQAGEKLVDELLLDIQA